MNKRIAGIAALNTAARKHEEGGNLVLSKWMKESAERATRVYRNTEKALDKLDFVRERGNYYVSNKQEFVSDWYQFEEEFADNF